MADSALWSNASFLQDGWVMRWSTVICPGNRATDSACQKVVFELILMERFLKHIMQFPAQLHIYKAINIFLTGKSAQGSQPLDLLSPMLSALGGCFFRSCVLKAVRCPFSLSVALLSVLNALAPSNIYSFQVLCLICRKLAAKPLQESLQFLQISSKRSSRRNREE